MRSISIVAVAVVTLLAADGANAQGSFFNKRYCLSSGETRIPDCSYNTWQQCRASVSGAQHCSENSFWKQEAPAKKVRRPGRA